MKYSVAIAAHDAAETIAETLASVLTQSVPPSEVVVVDDGSEDSTAEIARAAGPSVHVISQSNSGVGAASSRAIRATTSPIVATVDADDIWLPHKMERQLEVMTKSCPRTLSFARHRLFKDGMDERASGPERPGLLRSDLVFWRTAFDEIGDIIDPPGGRGDLVDWLARAREAGFTFQMLDEVLVLRRIAPGSLSFGRDPEKDRGYLTVAFAAMKRRRLREAGSGS